MKNTAKSFVLAIGLMVTACTTTKIQQTTNEFTPPEGPTKTLMTTPDVEVGAILASGLIEPRAEWSIAARNNLQSAISAHLEKRDTNVTVMNADQILTPKQIQILKLTDTVVAASESRAQLKHKDDVFDLTVGPEAAALKSIAGSDYALLTSASAAFQTAGKMAVNAAMLVLSAYTGTTTAIQVGAQQAQVSLVDLTSGDIVWTNKAILGGTDIRKPESAEKIAETLLKDFPLE